MYTSTPADVPDPPFRFFEGLAPRLQTPFLVRGWGLGTRLGPLPLYRTETTEAGRGLGTRLRLRGRLLSVHHFRPELFRILSGNVPRFVENKFVRARMDFRYASDWTD